MNYTKNIYEKKGNWKNVPKSGSLHVQDIYVDKRGLVWSGDQHLDCTTGQQTLDIFKELKLKAGFLSIGFSRGDKWWGLTKDARLLSIDLETLELNDHTAKIPGIAEAYWVWANSCHEDVLIGLPGKIIRFDSKKAVALDVEVGEFGLHHATLSPKGEIWFTNHLGVNRYDGKKIHTFKVNDLGIDSKVWEILITRDNVAWVGSMEEGVFKIEGDFSSYTKLESGLARYVPAIPLYEDRAGNIWLRFRAHSIACVTEYGIVHFTTEDGISSPHAGSVSEDEQGKLWFGYQDSGIGFYDAVNLVEIVPYCIHSTLNAHENGYFLGTPTSGILQYKDDKLSVISKNIACETRSSINYFPPNKLIINNHANGEVRMIDSVTGEILPIESFLTSFIYSVFCEKSGILWIAAETYLLRIEGEKRERFPYDELGFKKGRQVFFFENYKGDFCILHKNFQLIKIYYKGKFKDYNRILPPGTSMLSAAMEDRKKRLWLGCRDGALFCCTSKKVEKVNFTDEFSAFKITSLVEDLSGNILIGTSIGLLIYDGTVFQKIASFSASMQDSVTELNLLKDNDILISTLRGAYRYRQDPKSIPQISILRIVADKEYKSPSSLEIHTGVPFCNIHFNGISTKNGRIKYLYRLKGYDDEWKQTWSRNVRFDQLPMGNYEFQVRSVDSDLVYSDEVATIKIAVVEDPDKAQIDELEYELDRTRIFSENIIRSVQEAIIVIDLDGKIKMANYAAMNMLEYSSPEIEEKHISALLELKCKDLFNEEGIKRVLDQGVIKNHDCRMISLNGKEIEILLSATLLCDRNGKYDGIVIVATDMTLTNELQHQLQHKQKMESLGVMAGGIAHDFNNLLTVIIGNIDLIRMTIPENSKALNYSFDVKEAAIRASKLCSSLLDYTGKSFVFATKLDISRQVEGLLDLLRASISNKIELNSSLDHSVPAVMAGESQLDQIILNLITNASEAIGDNHGIISVTTCFKHMKRRELLSPYIKDSDIASGEYVVMEVSDTGCGMDKDLIKHIFEPFFTTKFTGRGLGLAAVHGIINSLNGSFKIQSKPGKGTTFKVFLPASASDKSTKNEKKNVQTKKAIQGMGKALFVDDETSVLAMGSQLLEHLGFSVIPAHDGVDAVEKFEKFKHELSVVIIDNTMPKMDGKEALERIYKISNKIPVIFSSGFSEKNFNKQFSDYKKLAFLHKPYSLDELTDALQKIGVLK